MSPQDHTPLVREATIDDAPGFTAFLAALFAEGLATIWRDEPTNPVQGRLFLHGFVSQPRSVVFLAIDAEGSMCGCLHFMGHRHAQRAHSGMLGLSVRHGMRGQGIGTLLLEALESWARERGFRRLELEVFGNNPRGAALYERLGYEHEGARRAAVEVDGEFIDLRLMAKTLVEA